MGSSRPAHAPSMTVEVPGSKPAKVGDLRGPDALENSHAGCRPLAAARQQLPAAPPQGQAALLKDQLELVRVKQPDGPARYSIRPLEAEFSFDKGFFMFVRAIQLLTQHNKDTILVRAGRAAAASGATARRRERLRLLPCRCCSARCVLAAGCCASLLLTITSWHSSGDSRAAASLERARPAPGRRPRGQPPPAPNHHRCPPPPRVLPQVGLAGPSGSGKTAFSAKIKSFIPGCALLSMDNYNDGSKVIDGNFDGAPPAAPPSCARLLCTATLRRRPGGPPPRCCCWPAAPRVLASAAAAAAAGNGGPPLRPRGWAGL